MNNFKKLLIGAALLVGASTANAQVTCTTTQCTGPAAELIQGLFPSPDGGVQIQVAASSINSLTCTGVNGNPVIALPATHLNYNQTYATLLTASVAGNRIQLRADDSEATCTLFFARMFNN